jgi:quercetin dioxygenase-like cupin family protein
VLGLGAVGFTGQAPAPQTSATNQREERMPRAGIDPGGVITGNAMRLPSGEVSTLRIRFDAGARTIWHTHPGPQIIVVLEGVGRVQQRGGKIVEIKPGEAFYAPPNVAHWHGASPQIAATMLSLYPIGSKLEPGPEVTPSEYLGK